MIVDLHNHTTLCNHAEGTIDEYIKKAIASGTKFFGFSEHAPMNFDPKYRLSFEQMQIYEKNVLIAKKKYENEIESIDLYYIDELLDIVIGAKINDKINKHDLLEILEVKQNEKTN